MDWIPEGFPGLMCVIGMVLCLIILIFALAFLGMGIKDLLNEARWKHQYNHRFDKPPTAKCYCRDCEMHGISNKCTLPGSTRYTPDNGFCYEAEPMTLDHAKRRANDGKTD